MSPTNTFIIIYLCVNLRSETQWTCWDAEITNVGIEGFSQQNIAALVAESYQWFRCCGCLCAAAAFFHSATRSNALWLGLATNVSSPKVNRLGFPVNLVHIFLQSVCVSVFVPPLVCSLCFFLSVVEPRCLSSRPSAVLVSLIYCWCYNQRFAVMWPKS